MYTISADDKQLYDDGTLSLKGLVKAYKEQNPRLAEYACKLAILDPYPVKQVQYARTTVALVGYSRARDVYTGLKSGFKSMDGYVEEYKKEFTFTGAKDQQVVVINDANNDDTFARAQVLCVVVEMSGSVDTGIERWIAKAKQNGISKATLVIELYYSTAEDAKVSNIVESFQESCERHGLTFDVSNSIVACASRLYRSESKTAFKKMAELLGTVEAPVSVSQMAALKGYAKFRRAYHKDAIRSSILEEIQPRFEEPTAQWHQVWRKKKAELLSQRFTQFQQESPDHIPDRVKLGEFMLMLYDDNSPYAEQQLLQMVRYIPLKWGPWQAFKFILKRGMLDQRWLLFTAVYKRWTRATEVIYTQRYYRSSLSERYLPNDPRKVKWKSPTSVSYSDRDQYKALNRIGVKGIEITTESRKFLEKMFERIYSEQYQSLSLELQELITTELLMVADTFNRGYKNFDLWAMWARSLKWRSAEAGNRLMRVWQRAKLAKIRNWAFKLLQRRHASLLVDLPTDWIVENGLNPKSPANVRTFIRTWICKPMTTIQKEDFIECQLHRVILTFLDEEFGSLQSKYVQYACDFVRQFMDELTEQINLDKVLWLLRHRDETIHELGVFLLFPDGEKSSPYQEQLNLDFWTDLISDDRMHTYAVAAIKNRFKQQITLEWLKARLYSEHQKEVTLAKTFIRDGFHVRDIDFYPLYYTNLFTQPGRYSLYEWSWNALSKQDVNGESLIGRYFTEVDYRRMLLSTQDQNVRYAIDAYQNQKVTQEDFSIDLLKYLFSDKEWSRSTFPQSDFLEEADPSLAWKNEISVRLPSRLGRTLREFAFQTMKSRTDFTLGTLGFQWVFERRQQSGSEYALIRDMFMSEFPNYALLLLNGTSEGDLADTEENNRLGVQSALDVLDDDLMYNGNKAKFWRTFLIPRLERVAEYNGQPFEYTPDCTIDPSLFSFEWFNTQIVNDDTRSQYHRGFALKMAKFFLSDWIATTDVPFGFKSLEPYLFSPFKEVADFFFDVVDNPQTMYAKIDLNGPAFQSDELFKYCYSSDANVRSTGLRFIQQYPEKFAQPDKLVELTTSPDQNVRALVIEILYNIAHIPIVTPNWRPYEDSVIPGNSQLSDRSGKKWQVSYSNPPKQLSSTKQMKYLGKGTSSNLEPHLTDHTKLILFAVQQLFQVPASPRNDVGAENQKVPMWKMKRNLIESFRDLALQDRVFAELIVPVFEELTQYKGKLVREASWTALAYLDERYVDNPLTSLTVFSD